MNEKKNQLPEEKAELNDQQLEQAAGGVLPPIQIERYHCPWCGKSLTHYPCPGCGYKP